MIRKDDLIDVPERRAISWNEFEVRAEGNTLKFEGYASIFDRGYDVHGGPNVGGWTEMVNRSAFKRTLTEKPDVVLLLNHEGLPLARTKSGTLQLSTDSTGLLSRSNLDLRDPDVKSIAIKMERGDLNEMSFAFRVKQQSWSDDESIRSLDEVSLHKGDVSIVTFGANPYTSSTLRGAIHLLANGELTQEQLAEVRAMSDQVDRAMAALRDVRADKEPYGDVDYADPGYQEDGQKRYPLSSAEQTRAAWSYINMPKNQKDYSPAELTSIKDKIKAAAKKFGIEIDDEKNSLLRYASDPKKLLAGLDAVLDEAADLTEGVDRAGLSEPVGQALDLLVAAQGVVGHLMGTMGVFDPDSPEKNSLRSLSDGFQDGNDDDTYHGGDSLAQAVHDLVADAAGCAPAAGTTQVPDEPYSRNLTVAEADQPATGAGNLTLAEAARMCRPDNSPEPLSVEDALRLAS